MVSENVLYMDRNKCFFIKPIIDIYNIGLLSIDIGDIYRAYDWLRITMHDMMHSRTKENNFSILGDGRDVIGQFLHMQ